MQQISPPITFKVWGLEFQLTAVERGIMGPRVLATVGEIGTTVFWLEDIKLVFARNDIEPMFTPGQLDILFPKNGGRIR